MADAAVVEERALIWRYTRRYLLAMGLVTCAIVLGALHINQVLELNRLESEVIRTASAQHAVAQRILLLPDRVAAETNNYKKSRVLDGVSKAVDQMRAGHNFLMNGSGNGSPPAEATELLQKMYSISGQRLDRDVNRFLDAYVSYLASPETANDAITLQRVNAESFLLVSLARAAELHTQAAEAKMAEAISLHRMWVSIALFLILMVVIFVFRPLARNAGKAVATMSAELDEGANLLSRSFKIAKLGHWRTISSSADTIWLSKEIIDLLELELKEGLHPLSSLQLGGAFVGADADACSLQLPSEPGKQTIARSQFKKPNGDVIDLIIHMDAELDATGKVVGVVGVVKDNTTESEADRALMKSYEVIERKSNNLVEAQRLGKLCSWRRQLDSKSVEWDESAYEFMRLTPDTFEPSLKNVRSLYVKDGPDRIIAMNQMVVKTGEPQSETVQARRGDGSLVDLYVRSKLELDDNGKPFAVFGTMQDISKERAAARELEKLAYFDGLTGLANRTLFNRELNRVSEACAQREQKAALLIIDLDHFKEVNDTLGHQAGDQLLGIIAERLANTLSDVGFVARLGGDEFAVLVENNVSKSELDKLCKEIIEQVNVPANLTLGTVETNASIGIALAPLHSSEPEELLSFADLALYSSKEQGRGRACYYDRSYSKALATRISLGTKIRAALDEKRFEVHYQPIVDVRRGTVSHFEALLRLPMSDGGYIPPSEFIPVAESSHLIADLGAFVLHEACNEAQSWIDAELPKRPISVNVSAAQIWHGDLEEVVDSALNTSGLDPRLLCIELTESVFVADNFNRLKGILNRLKERGIQLALDDFGTGYSSLGYLNRLPFDTLKVDRMFVSKAHESAEKRKMLRGVVSLAKGLNLKVTAEGVELEAEMDLVRELGCDAVQGWYFGRALPGHKAVVDASRIDAQSAMASLLNKQKDSRRVDPFNRAVVGRN